MRILLLLVVLPLAWAQFPAVCNTQESIDSKTCCPNNCGTRGTCVSIREKVMDTWPSSNPIVKMVCEDRTPQDVRCQWPTRVFEMVCRCNTGWGGYDCSQCDFGFINVNGNCVNDTKQLLIRKNFKTLTLEKRKEYIKVLSESKNEAENDMEWAVVVHEPNETGGSFILQNVATYDMFVAVHFLAVREQLCPDNMIDFAHRKPAFLTWHRYYLLIVERELQRIARRMNITNFTLAYWDWTLMDTNVFAPELFGTPEYRNEPENVVGNLFDSNNWPIIYDRHYDAYKMRANGMEIDKNKCDSIRSLRDVVVNRAENLPLQRGFIQDVTGRVKPFLPKDNSIMMALTATNYAGDDGFNRRLEGFVDLCAGENPPCTFFKEGVKTINNLHNAVHIYLGGHMRVVPSASNEPIFFLHHANIDRIFERWLQKLNRPLDYESENDNHPGHRANDTLVPFFPLKTNADMYKISSELGFRYDSMPWEVDGTDPEVCMDPGLMADVCNKGGTSPDTGGGTSTTSSGGGGTSTTSSGGGGTSTTSSGGGGTSSPDAGSSNFHIPFHLILIAGASVLMVLKLFSM